MVTWIRRALCWHCDHEVSKTVVTFRGGLHWRFVERCCKCGRFREWEMAAPW